MGWEDPLLICGVAIISGWSQRGQPWPHKPISTNAAAGSLLHAKPDLSATLLANLKAYIAGGVIEASGNV
jgi:hypothetical protein